MVPSNGVVFTVFTKKRLINAPSLVAFATSWVELIEKSCDVFADVFGNGGVRYWPVQDHKWFWQC